MEELRSTEILDREIQYDARRKAEKILKTCDSDCRQIADEVTQRVAMVQVQKEAEYAKKIELYIKDSQSSIPLEKQRRLVSFIDTSVQKALDQWFVEIGKKKQLALLTQLLHKYTDILSHKKLEVIYSGYTQDDIQELVNELFGKENIDSVSELSTFQSRSERFSDGMYIKTTDNTIVCRATLTEIREDLLSNRREELAKALMGGRLPQ